MSFETKTVLLTSPVDVTLDADVAVARLNDATWVGIQNTGSVRVYWRETTAEPVATDRGHYLDPGAGIIALVIHDNPF